MFGFLVIFYVLLLDALVANALAWFSQDWYIKHFRVFSRLFPMAKGWTTYYLILVLFIGFILYQTDILIF